MDSPHPIGEYFNVFLMFKPSRGNALTRKNKLESKHSEPAHICLHLCLCSQAEFVFFYGHFSLNRIERESRAIYLLFLFDTDTVDNNESEKEQACVA